MLTLWYLILGWKEYNKLPQTPNQSAGKPADPIKKPELIPQKRDGEPTKPTDIRKPEQPKSIPIDPRPSTIPPRNIDLNNKVTDLPKAPEIPKPSSPKDIPKVPDAPKPAFPTKVPDIPKMPDLPKVPTDFSDPPFSSALKTHDSIKISEPPKVPNLPKFSPKAPEIPKLPEPSTFAPKTPESPKLPEPPKFAPKTPESPKLPEPSKFTPRTPESPKLPEPSKFAPKTPDSPKVPQFYKGPKTPEDTPKKFDLPNFPSKTSDANFNQEPFSPFKPDTPGNQKPTAKGDELFGMGNNLKGFNSPSRSPGNLRDLSYGRGELPDTDEWAPPKPTSTPHGKTPKYMEESVISNPDSLESEEEDEEDENF